MFLNNRGFVKEKYGTLIHVCLFFKREITSVNFYGYSKYDFGEGIYETDKGFTLPQCFLRIPKVERRAWMKVFRIYPEFQIFCKKISASGFADIAI